MSVFNYFQIFTIHQAVTMTFITMNYIFAFSAIFTYLIVCTLTFQLFHQMKIDIEAKAEMITACTAKRSELEFYLSTWRHRYIQLTQLVDSINQCFGLILLQTIIYLFLILINGTFFISVIMKSRLSTFFIINHCSSMFFFIFVLLTLTYLPSKLKGEVIIITFMIYLISNSKDCSVASFR